MLPRTLGGECLGFSFCLIRHFIGTISSTQSQEASPDGTGIRLRGSRLTAKADATTLWEHLARAATTASSMAVSAYDALATVTVRQGPRPMHRDALVLNDSKSLCYFCGILQMNCVVVCMRSISRGLMDLNVWSPAEGSVWGVYGIPGR